MSQDIATKVRCGDFEVDLKAGELHGLGRSIRLQEQPLQVLRTLIQAPGQVVTREEIKKHLWPNDTVVEFDNAINTAIKKLRVALNDSNKTPKYIETIARRGYRFIMPVERIEGGGGDFTKVAISAASEPSPLAGRNVSHYRLLGVIGGGGMGVVYRAEDVKLDRPVAIKFLPEEMGSDQRAVERFEREARAASALDHPNICPIYEFGEYESQPFIVMPLLQGETLRDQLAVASSADNAGRARRAVALAVQIASGLEAAHEKAIVHRDIKPANIFITSKEVAKILDFGLAKVLEGSSEQVASAAAAGVGTFAPGSMDLSLSREGIALGTAGYMSPEQIRGENLDARTDLFSFGLVLYEMVTGRRAFTGETAEAARDAILYQSPTPVRQLNPAVSPQLELIINRMLERNRELRYQSATELLGDLTAVKPIDTAENKGAAPPHSQRWKWMAAASSLVLCGLVAFGIYARASRPLLAEKDTIVLADFTNATREAIFDDSLRQALAVQFDQSPYVNVLSDRRMSATLSQMERSTEQPVTTDVAIEICQRTGGKAVLAGSISRAENSYDIELKALSCQTGHTLAAVETVANDRGEVLKELGIAGNQMRSKLGESLASVSKFDQPLLQATTSSLEALKALSQTKRYGSPTESIPQVKRALELDPNFALAYAELGADYMNVGEAKLGAENIKKAYDLRERTSQRERFYIEVTYYTMVTRELDKAEQSGREWKQNYPEDWRPHNDLAIIYAQLGKTEEAVADMREVIRLTPDNSGAYGNLIGMLTALGRFDEAQTVYEQARSRQLDNPYLRQFKYNLAFLQRDEAGMREQVQWALGKPRIQDVFLSAESNTEAYYGRMQNARKFSEQAREAAQRADSTETAAGMLAAEAVREAEIGNSLPARHYAEQALAANNGYDVRIYAALALARAGDIARAQQLADDLNREFPLDTMLQNYDLPVIRAAIQLQQNKPLQAIESLAPSTPYELGQASLGFLYPAYLRGHAYLGAGQPEKAVAEFQKVLDHPGITQNFITGVLAYRDMGLAQAQMGNKEAARKSYQQFLTLWQNADADVPVYRQAKAEYAKLQ